MHLVPRFGTIGIASNMAGGPCITLNHSCLQDQRPGKLIMATGALLIVWRLIWMRQRSVADAREHGASLGVFGQQFRFLLFLFMEVEGLT